MGGVLCARRCELPWSAAPANTSRPRGGVPDEGVPAGHPTPDPPGRYRRRHGQPSGSPRVPHLAARQDHPTAAGIPAAGNRRVPACAAARSPPSPGSASSTTPSSSAARSPGSRRPSSTPCPCPAARRCRTRPPVPPRPRRRRHQRRHEPPAARHEQWTPRPSPALGARRHHRPAFVRDGRMDLLATNRLGRAMHAAPRTTAPPADSPTSPGSRQSRHGVGRVLHPRRSPRVRYRAIGRIGPRG